MLLLVPFDLPTFRTLPPPPPLMPQALGSRTTRKRSTQGNSESRPRSRAPGPQGCEPSAQPNAGERPLTLAKHFGPQLARLPPCARKRRCLAVVLLTAAFMVKNARWRGWGPVVVGRRDGVM